MGVRAEGCCLPLGESASTNDWQRTAPRVEHRIRGEAGESPGQRIAGSVGAAWGLLLSAGSASRSGRRADLIRIYFEFPKIGMIFPPSVSSLLLEV